MSAQQRAERFAAMDAEAQSSGSARAVHDPVLPCEAHWLEIECFDDDGGPMGGRAFVLRRASGAPVRPGETEIRGALDEQGYARIVRISDTADCLVEFPDLEEAAEAVPMYPGFWAEVESRRGPASGG